MKLKSDPLAKYVFNNYPMDIRPKVEHLRDIIIESAREIPEINELEETLKWGEPSYITKYGSTIRIDWKEKESKRYSIYFKCTSKLVPTFKEIFGDTFDYENNRAIHFDLEQKIPEEELKICIKAALMYHRVKNIESLGIC